MNGPVISDHVRVETHPPEAIMSEPTSRARTARRDFDIWQRYAAGDTQDDLAAEYGISQSQVSRIVTRMKDDVPIDERRARQRRQLEELDHLRGQALELADADPIPAYSNGRPIRMANGEQAEDHTGRVRAMDMVVKLQEREAKALGLDSAVKVEHGGKLTYEILGVDLDKL
jgi:transposase